MACALLLGLAGCGGGAAGGGPTPRMGAEFARPVQIYRQLGLLAGPDEFPAVGGLAMLLGPGDSTLVLFGLSFPADVFRFRRDGETFAAEYVVALRFERDGQLVRLVDRRETVRVPTFAETGRSDESVVFQTAVTLEPGAYLISVRVRDGLSARGFEASDTVLVPAFGAGRVRLTAPIPVYEGTERSTADAPPRLILNPRHTAPYGGAPARVYIERYGGEGPVTITARDDRNEVVWHRELPRQDAEAPAGAAAEVGAEGDAGGGVVAWVVELPMDSVPMGTLSLVAESGEEASAASPLLVTISDGWLVANFEEVLQFLRYIATAEEVSELRIGSPEARRAAWERFWAQRDPVPATPANEYRESFFQRIRVATEQFSEAGTPGWRTDRGEVYIVLGPPADVIEGRMGDDVSLSGRGNAQQWIYERTPIGRLDLVFVDRNGFGHYEMLPQSRAAFRQLAARLKQRHAR